MGGAQHGQIATTWTRTKVAPWSRVTTGPNQPTGGARIDRWRNRGALMASEAVRDALGSMRREIDNFLHRRPGLARPLGADNQCLIATNELIDDLLTRGIAASAVWVREHRIVPVDPAPRAVAADRHRIVRLPDGWFVDVTRRQFGSAEEHPTYYLSETDLASHWCEVDRGPADGAEDEERWETLSHQ